MQIHSNSFKFAHVHSISFKFIPLGAAYSTKTRGPFSVLDVVRHATVQIQTLNDLLGALGGSSSRRSRLRRRLALYSLCCAADPRSHSFDFFDLRSRFLAALLPGRVRKTRVNAFYNKGLLENKVLLFLELLAKQTCRRTS